MQKFDSIRPFYDAEVNDNIKSSLNHPMMKAIMTLANIEYDDANADDAEAHDTNCKRSAAQTSTRKCQSLPGFASFAGIWLSRPPILG
jgi:hypothetical protein